MTDKKKASGGGGVPGAGGVGGDAAGAASTSHSSSSPGSGQSDLPPLSNTGVTKSSHGENEGTWSGVDYLTFTLPGALPQSEIEPPAAVGVEVLELLPKSVKGNYNRAWSLYPAGTLYHHSEDARQGWHYEFKGSELAALRAGGVSPVALLAWLVEFADSGHKVNIARIDLALDFLGMGCKVARLRESYENGGMKTRLADKWIDSLARDGSRAWTLYLGAVTSDKRLVLYDKAKEQDQLERDWTRVEGRFKAKQAMMVVRAVVEHGVLAVIKDMALRSVDFEDTWWSEQLEQAGDRLVEPVRRKDTDTATWVQRSAIPGTVGYLTENLDPHTFRAGLNAFLALAKTRYKAVVERDVELLAKIRELGL